jgi:hypothetical protein
VYVGNGVYVGSGVKVFTFVDVGRRKIKVGVLEGVPDGVWLGEGVIEGVDVGEGNMAVWVEAAAAVWVCTIMVSITPGIEVGISVVSDLLITGQAKITTTAIRKYFFMATLLYNMLHDFPAMNFVGKKPRTNPSLQEEPFWSFRGPTLNLWRPREVMVIWKNQHGMMFFIKVVLYP